MTAGIFDTHVHYDDEAFDEDRDELLASLPGSGVACVVNAASDTASTEAAWQLAMRWPYVYAMVGVHPDGAPDMDESKMQWLACAASREKVLAIGEIGLDYYWHKNESEHEIQKTWFIRQLDLAREKDLPVMIHTRDAAADTLEIIKEYARGLTCDIHCFPYSVEMAREYLNLGHYLGVGGVVTFRNGRKLKEVVQYAPLDRILLETDSPYLAPSPNRGKRNSSLNLPYVVDAVAELKGITPEKVIEATFENAVRFYRMRQE